MNQLCFFSLMSLAVLPISIVLDWAHLMEKILHHRAMVALSMIALRSNAGAGRARSDRRHQTAMMAVGSKGPKEFSVPRLGTGTWAWGNKVVWGYEESKPPNVVVCQKMNVEGFWKLTLDAIEDCNNKSPVNK